jgi:hypothetical protein
MASFWGFHALNREMPTPKGPPMARCSQVGIIMINGSNLRESAGPKILVGHSSQRKKVSERI